MAVAGVQNGFRRPGFFDLDGGMVDSKPLARKFLDFREHQVTAQIFIGNDDVTAHGQNAGGQRPYMEIMDGLDTADAPSDRAEVKQCSTCEGVPSRRISTASRISTQELDRIKMPTMTLIAGSAANSRPAESQGWPRLRPPNQ